MARARRLAEPQGRGRGRAQPCCLRRADDARPGAARHRQQLGRTGAEARASRAETEAEATPKPSPPKPSGWCSASAAYNNTYNDYDVYVESNQPDQDATVSGDGKTASYYTNSSGYADVYFYAGPSAAGDAVSVEVGDATCSTTL